MSHPVCLARHTLLLAGFFRLVWRQCRGRALTLRLRTVFLFVPQPVAACLRIPVAARRRPELASILLSEQLPSACSYLAAKWQLDVAHTPSATFTRWYMTRLTCGPLLLEACHQGCVPVNILDHLQIPHFRLVAQIRLPVLGAPGSRPLPRLPAATTGLPNASRAGAAAWGGNPTCATPAARYHTTWGLSTGRGCRCCTELALLPSHGPHAACNGTSATSD